jgi:hypothetical protein
MPTHVENKVGDEEKDVSKPFSNGPENDEKYGEKYQKME